MTNFLLADGANVGTLIMVGVLIIMMVVYLVFGTMNRKKQQEQAMKMLNELKAGDHIVTNAGIYGEIVSQKETDMGRVVVLKTGNEDDPAKASYITVNASVILGIDHKKDLILDANGNVIEPEEVKEEILKPASKPEDKEENGEEKGSDGQEKHIAPKREPATSDQTEN